MRGLAKVISFPDAKEAEKEDLVKVRDVIRELGRIIPKSVFRRHFQGEMWQSIEKHAKRELREVAKCHMSSASYCEVELARFCAAFLINSVLQNLLFEIGDGVGKIENGSGRRFLTECELSDNETAIFRIQNFVRQRLRVEFIPKPTPHILVDVQRLKRQFSRRHP